MRPGGRGGARRLRDSRRFTLASLLSLCSLLLLLSWSTRPTYIRTGPHQPGPSRFPPCLSTARLSLSLSSYLSPRLDVLSHRLVDLEPPSEGVYECSTRRTPADPCRCTVPTPLLPPSVSLPHSPTAMESQSILSDTSYQAYEEYGDNLRIAAVRLTRFSLPSTPCPPSSLSPALCRRPCPRTRISAGTSEGPLAHRTRPPVLSLRMLTPRLGDLSPLDRAPRPARAPQGRDPHQRRVEAHRRKVARPGRLGPPRRERQAHRHRRPVLDSRRRRGKGVRRPPQGGGKVAPQPRRPHARLL